MKLKNNFMIQAKNVSIQEPQTVTDRVIPSQQEGLDAQS